MGCLCSSDRTVANKPMVRSASVTSASSSDYIPGSFLPRKSEKSFYQDYKLGKDVIGFGSHGEIRLCERKLTGQTLAVKIINKASLPAEVIRYRLIQKQFTLVSSLSHPSILKLHDFFEDRCSYFIVMDYIKGGDLYEKLKTVQYFTETSAARVMKQILSAIAHMHSKKIAHRDIKPENIMIEEKSSEMAVKIIDFDTAVSFEGKKLRDKQGSLYYLAPEVLRGEYTEKCDLWSAGVTMFVMLTNTFPFADEDIANVEQMILEGELDVEYLKEEGISSEAISLLSKLLDKDPDSRYSAFDASHHGWILKYSYYPLPKPITSGSYNVLAHGLKLWAAKFLIPSNELTEFHLAFVQTDYDSDGFLQQHEIYHYLEKASEAEAANIIKNGYWEKDDRLDFYEFISVMANKEFWIKHTEKICAEFDWGRNEDLATSEFVWFLQSQLKSADRFKQVELPSRISKEDILGFLAM